MDTEDSVLLGDVKAKRRELKGHIARIYPRKERLSKLAILGGSLATVLTAGPAMGGKSFATWLSAAFGLNAPAWQLLCAGAAASAAIATIATQLLKSDDLELKLMKAQAWAAKLEVLATVIELGEIEPGRAFAEYTKCVEDTAFTEIGRAV